MARRENNWARRSAVEEANVPDDVRVERTLSFSGLIFTDIQACIIFKQKPLPVPGRGYHFAPDTTRTCDPRFRKPLLYPAELLEHLTIHNLIDGGNNLTEHIFQVKK